MRWNGGVVGGRAENEKKGFEMRCIDSRVENHTANSRLCKAMKKCSPGEEVKRAFGEPEEIHTYHEEIHYILKHVHKCLLLLRKGVKERFFVLLLFFWFFSLALSTSSFLLATFMIHYEGEAKVVKFYWFLLTSLWWWGSSSDAFFASCKYWSFDKDNIEYLSVNAWASLDHSHLLKDRRVQCTPSGMKRRNFFEFIQIHNFFSRFIVFYIFFLHSVLFSPSHFILMSRIHFCCRYKRDCFAAIVVANGQSLIRWLPIVIRTVCSFFVLFVSCSSRATVELGKTKSWWDTYNFI